ncbi:MAG: hypothetical protein HY259_01760 [Chloroflexi bacterium]|nr:hypothetical protein [Chloroflexota bacterium]MBI3732168.1 hypothetical protein [Chloroflexota bacterium]
MKTLWQRFRRLSSPAKAALGAGLAGGVLAGIGWAVDPQYAARTAASLVMAVGLSSMVWGTVAWAIVTAVADVEHDLTESTLKSNQRSSK